MWSLPRETGALMEMLMPDLRLHALSEQFLDDPLQLHKAQGSSHIVSIHVLRH